MCKSTDSPSDTGKVWTLITRSGSTYRITEDANGSWWFCGNNIPNRHSARLDPDRWWRIERPDPWPPDLGRPIVLCAPQDFEFADPRRVPGGGKFTSPVRAIRHPR